MKIITEEMNFKKKMCEYAKKHGVTRASREYHTNRKFVYRQLEKYDGTVRSLAKWESRKKHRIDGEKFYGRHRFISKEDMHKKLSRYNNISRKVLDFILLLP